MGRDVCVKCQTRVLDENPGSSSIDSSKADTLAPRARGQSAMGEMDSGILQHEKGLTTWMSASGTSSVR
jgi:hypothetical protein